MSALLDRAEDLCMHACLRLGPNVMGKAHVYSLCMQECSALCSEALQMPVMLHRKSKSPVLCMGIKHCIRAGKTCMFVACRSRWWSSGWSSRRWTGRRTGRRTGQHSRRHPVPDRPTLCSKGHRRYSHARPVQQRLLSSGPIIQPRCDPLLYHS